MGDSGKCQKFSFWQLGRCFWHFRMDFWQITVVRIAGEPIKRAFEVIFRECQKFGFWQWDRCFWHFGKYFWEGGADFWHSGIYFWH